MRPSESILGPSTGWQTLLFDACATQTGIDRKASVRQGDYQRNGRFPVVDQGAGLIAGYTDQDDLIHTNDLPLILFGDHTRVFKYLDFPFATGADGTKLLRANADVVDPRFLYYVLLHQDIPSRGYSRHFRYLRNRSISLPTDRQEQRAIAAVLERIQTAVEVQDRIVATLKEVKAATMAKLFREGLRGEPLKQTEIGDMPTSWRVVVVGDLLRFHSGETRPRDLSPERSERTPFPVYGGNGVMGYSARFLTSREAIIIGRVGAYCGSVHVCPAFSWISDNALYHRDAISERASLHYVAEFLTHVGLNRLRRIGSQPLITQGTVQTIRIPLPERDEQAAIARTAELLACSVEWAEHRLGNLGHLFSSMLHLLMTAQVRVLVESPVGVEATTQTTSSEVSRHLERFASGLVRRFDPDRVILFGPPVAGSPRAFGDVGLLVEMPFRGLSRDQAARIAREIPHDFSLDLLVRRPEELRRAGEIGDRYLGGILERGRVLYTRPPSAPARQPTEAETKAPRRPPQVLTEEMLRAIVRRIVEAAAPERIVLFGSAARGEMGPDSDVDLLVVKACADRREVARTIRQYLIGVAPRLPKDIIVVTPEDVERDRDTIGYIIRPALRDGRVVYAA